MKQSLHRSVGIALAALLVGQGAFAEGLPARVGEPAGALEGVFSEAPREGLRLLDEGAMSDTEGELWPFIGAVVTVDLALATFFWGAYVPTVTGSTGAGCPVCYQPGGRPR